MTDYRTHEVDVVFCIHCRRPLFTIFVDNQLSGICLNCHRISDELELKDAFKRMGRPTSPQTYH